MKLILRVSLIVLVVVSAAAGLSWYYFFRTPTPLDIHKVGGTILVYELADDAAKGSDRLEELAHAVRERIRDVAINPPSVEIAPPRRIEIAIVREPGHEDHVEQVKDLLARVGRLEFRIVANRHDDELALDTADNFYNAASADWQNLRKAVQDQFLEGKEGLLDGVTFDDVAGLVSRLVERKPQLSAREARQFIEKTYRPGKQLLQMREAASAGLPPPPPVSKPGNDFVLANEGAREATYTWMPLSRSEIASLAGSRNKDWDATIAESLQSGLPFRNFKIVEPNGFPAILGVQGFETLFYARKPSLPQGKAPSDCFVLTRDPEKGREVNGTHLERAQEDFDRDGKRAVGVRFNRKGAERFFELTSRNKPDSEFGRRYLAIILDGVVMSAPNLNGAIRDAAIIEGRFTQDEVANMVRILRAGELPLRLKPIPVLEKVIEPGATP